MTKNGFDNNLVLINAWASENSLSAKAAYSLARKQKVKVTSVGDSDFIVPKVMDAALIQEKLDQENDFKKRSDKQKEVYKVKKALLKLVLNTGHPDKNLPDEDKKLFKTYESAFEKYKK